MLLGSVFPANPQVVSIKQDMGEGYLFWGWFRLGPHPGHRENHMFYSVPYFVYPEKEIRLEETPVELKENPERSNSSASLRFSFKLIWGLLQTYGHGSKSKARSPPPPPREHLIQSNH